MENPIKMDDLGYHHFWKHPYVVFWLFFDVFCCFVPACHVDGDWSDWSDTFLLVKGWSRWLLFSQISLAIL